MTEIYCRIKLQGYDLFYSTKKGRFNGEITHLTSTGKVYKYKNVDLAIKSLTSIIRGVYVSNAQVKKYGLESIVDLDYTGTCYKLSENAVLELVTYEMVQKTVKPLFLCEEV